ncbi:MAG TPA: FAD:protein FMN transferase [Terriglobia bacterium]|nr:FAD:protein FMN transferase [Terriglobia bacterium]
MQLEPALTPSSDLPNNNNSTFRYQDSHDAMGTTFDLAAYGADGEFLAAVFNEVFEEIDRLEQQMSKFRYESEISHINRNASRHSIMVEPKLFGLIQCALRVSAQTDGAFDITIGPLMKSWGFFRHQGRVPGDGEIGEILKSTGHMHVKSDSAARTVRFDHERVELDLGALAKGYALDRAVEILRGYCVTSALVSSGMSSIYALGSPPGERAWEIKLRDPFDAAKAADAILLKNCSISTSGNYVRFFKLDGKTYSHIINPATGWPAEGMLSTAVASVDTTESEALSTALYVLGPERAAQILAGRPNLSVVYYQPGDKPETFKRVAARSSSFNLPPDVVAEIKWPWYRSVF